MALPLLQNLDVKEKKVLVRVDFNVPIDPQGHITDDTRIRESLPTLQYLLDHDASIIILSHLGRPKNKRDPSLSLKPCAERLEKLLQQPVFFAQDIFSEETKILCTHLQPKQIVLLENLRFYPAEETPSEDPSFAKKLAALGDVYVNDAFGTAHRAHSSTFTIASYFPNKKGAGFLLQKEIEELDTLLQSPKHPFYAIIGGSKVSSKFGVLHSLLKKVDALFIGGGMAYTFLQSQGISIGDSIVEPSLEEEVRVFLDTCNKNKVRVWLPEDLVIANRFAQNAESRVIDVEQGIPKGWQGMDIGPKTLQKWEKELTKAATIFWNGPVGVFEFTPFASGTNTLAKHLATLQASVVVGGGDSVAAINALHLSSHFTHVSTGGGASLEYLELGKLPGIDALYI